MQGSVAEFLKPRVVKVQPLTPRHARVVIEPFDSIPTLTSWQYRRQVSVTYPTSAFGGTISSGDLVLVTVTVTTAGGRTFDFSKIIAKTPVVR